MKKVAVLQSNYIPWKGVFDLINQVDCFVFLEDVQFTKRDWRTRNKIKTANGSDWLSIPIQKASRDTKIFEVQISQEIEWQNKHYSYIKHSYSKSPYLSEYKWLLDEIYLDRKWMNLSEFNIFVTKLISKVLGIRTEFVNSKELNVCGIKDDRLIEICKKVNGGYYLSGPSAKDYINNEKFLREDIKLAYIVYDYPEYKQLFGEFDHYVSVLDVIFNCGPNSSKYIFKNKVEEVI